MEAVNQDRRAVSLIDAQSVFDEEYTPGSKKRAEFQSAYLEHVRKRRRMDRIRALPSKTKKKLVLVLRGRAARPAARI